MLVFTPDDTPGPPAASSEFLDIAKLSAQRDDTSPDWHCIPPRQGPSKRREALAGRVLPHQGPAEKHVVAEGEEQLVQVEGGRSQMHFSHRCQADGLLQVIIERYRQGTPEQF